jgi:hypothetical protein
MLELRNINIARLMKASQASVVLAFLSLFVTLSFANAAVDALDILQRERTLTLVKLEKSGDIDAAAKDRLTKDVASLDREIARWQKSPQQPMLAVNPSRTTKSSRGSMASNGQVGSKLDQSVTTQVLAVNSSSANSLKLQQTYSLPKTIGIVEFPE